MPDDAARPDSPNEQPDAHAESATDANQPAEDKLIRVQFAHDATVEQIYEGMQMLFAMHATAESVRDGEETTEPPSAE